MGMALLTTSSGCIHNHYYTPAAGCPPTVTSSAGVVDYGALCEVPNQVVNGGTVVSGKPLVASPVLGGARPPRVVVSQPGGSRLGSWRNADPEGGLATTRVEGAIDDPTLKR
jgi:hypothetical protein